MPTDYQGSARGERRGGGGGKGKGGREMEICDAVERGLVATMKDNFGFIKCEDRPEELFFHFSDVRDRDGVRPGDSVEFRVGRSRGKVNAVEITMLPRGTVVLEELLEGPFQGVVKLPAMQPRKGQSASQESQGMIEVSNEESGATETVSYRNSDCQERRGFRKGDDVEFAIMLDKRSGRKSAIKIKMGKPTGANREQGIVQTVKDSFGFLECADRSARLFFHFSEMMDRNTGVRPGDEVEFTCAVDERKKQENATKIVFLPAGTVFFEVRICRPYTNAPTHSSTPPNPQ